MTCINCQKNISHTAKFCIHCGVAQTRGSLVHENIESPRKNPQRINRLNYLLGSIFAYGIFFLIIFIYAVIFYIYNPGGKIENDPIYGIVTLLAIIFLAVYGISLNVRRLHDLDLNAWTLLLNFVPLANIVMAICLFVTKGTTGSNKYGVESDQKISVDAIFKPWI